MDAKNTIKPLVTPDMPVDELAFRYPESISFLTKHGVRCIVCGEPLWCTLGELFHDDAVPDPEGLLRHLNEFLAQKNEYESSIFLTRCFNAHSGHFLKTNDAL